MSCVNCGKRSDMDVCAECQNDEERRRQEAEDGALMQDATRLPERQSPEPDAARYGGQLTPMPDPYKPAAALPVDQPEHVNGWIDAPDVEPTVGEILALSEDAMSMTRVWVINPDGVGFHAVLRGGGFAGTGVVQFYVEPEDAPEGEASGERCEFYRPVHPQRPPYRVIPGGRPALPVDGDQPDTEQRR